LQACEHWPRVHLKYVKPSEPGAEKYLPERRSLSTLRGAAARCKGCDLWRPATQTVFGEGPRHAQLVLVGEQPGDVEDREGKPFVGPAGRLLDEALEAAGLDRDGVYLTNAVKHFKYEPRGKRRLHQRPATREIWACKPWLEAELAVIRPLGVVCLGAVAAQSLFGSGFRVTQQRGQLLDSKLARFVMATVHPASILRAPTPEDRQRERAQFIHDLQTIAGALAKHARRTA
jgi:uracil-DNA glycosylase family protein